MNPDAEIRKFSQLVLADTSAKKALDRKLAVEMALLVPQRKLRGSKVESVGGFMGVPLRELRLGQGKPPFLVDDFLGKEAVKRREEVILVLDTGSQGFWVMDMTRGEDGASLMEQASLGSFVGDYELVLGDRGKETFTIKIPQQWRDFEGASQLLAQPPSTVKDQGLQCLIVGNPFMQAVAMTFSPRLSPPTVFFSHLDSEGRRCSQYQGPTTIVSRQQSALSLAVRPQEVRSGHLPLKDGRLHVPSLVDTSLAMAAPPRASSRKASDVTLDLRFMKFPSASAGRSRGGEDLISVESRSATDLIIPCLDVLVTDDQGNQVYNTHIFDTGSGVNLSLDVALDPAKSQSCPPGACYCASPGRVGATFAKSIASARNAEACGPCSNETTQSKQGGSAGICNTYCCTPEGVSCSDEMPCSVVFCTGVVSYAPKFSLMSFPSENSEDGGELHLQSVPRVFTGKAQAACVPGVQSGLFGAWYWDSPLKSPGSESSPTEASGLPYYLLEALGQIGTENENYTLKFWRTDLRKAPESVKVGASTVSNAQKAPKKPWWDGGGSPVEPPSPVAPPPTPVGPPPTPVAPSPVSPPSSPVFPPSSPGSPSPPVDPPASSPASPPAPPCNQDNRSDQRKSDLIGENASGTQQIVIVSGGGHDAAGRPLATPPLPVDASAPPVDPKGKRDWFLIGLAIAGVSLLVILLLVFLRQSPDSSYAFVPSESD